MPKRRSKYASENLIRKHAENLLIWIEETGNIPWTKPFDISGDWGPKNVTTGKHYTSLFNNLSLTAMMHISADRTKKSIDPRFFQLADARKKDIITKEKLSKDEPGLRKFKSVMIFYPMSNSTIVDNKDFDPAKPEGPDNMREKKRSFFTGKYGVGQVINVNDTTAVEDGIVEPLEVYLSGQEKKNPVIEDLQNICDSFPHEDKITMGIPSYNHVTKVTKIPEMKFAKSSEGYYSTVVHERAHQIGDMIGELKHDRTKKQYSFEELIAEMTASCVFGHCGFSEMPEHENSIAYIKSWVKNLKDDPMVLFKAAEKAKRRAKYLIEGFVPEKKIVNREDFPFLRGV